jgi:hypothetical protein
MEAFRQGKKMAINQKAKVLIILALMIIYVPNALGHGYHTEYCHTHYDFWYQYIQSYLDYELVRSDYLDRYIERYLGQCNV